MKFIFKGNPISKMRARHVNRGSFVMTYDPQEKLKELVKLDMTHQFKVALESKNREIVVEASNLTKASNFDVSLTFYLPISDNETLTQKNAKSWGFMEPTKKPDLDNLEKFYLDCANCTLFRDDCQITALQSKKLYSDKPRTEMEINEKQQLKLPKEAENILTIFSPEKLDELRKFLQMGFKELSCNIDPPDIEHKEKNLVNIATFLAQMSKHFGKEIAKLKKFENFIPKIKEIE